MLKRWLHSIKRNQYRISFVVLALGLVWSGFGHKMFDDEEPIWGIWSEWGSVKIWYNGYETRRFWWWHDLNINLTFLCLAGLILMVFSRWSNWHMRVGFVMCGALMVLQSLWDIAQMVITGNSNGGAEVEIVLTLMFVYPLLIMMKAVPLPKSLFAATKDGPVPVPLVYNDRSVLQRAWYWLMRVIVGAQTPSPASHWVEQTVRLAKKSTDQADKLSLAERAVGTGLQEQVRSALAMLETQKDNMPTWAYDSIQGHLKEAQGIAEVTNERIKN